MYSALCVEAAMLKFFVPALALRLSSVKAALDHMR